MNRVSRALGSCVTAGVFIYLVVMITLHLLRPDYALARRFLSEYSVGPFGFLGNAAFYVLAVTLLALAIGLQMSVRHSVPLALTCLLIGLAAVAFCTSALFPTDVQPAGGGRPISSRAGAIHDLSALAIFVALIVAALTLPGALKRDASWAPFSGIVRLFGLLILIGFICFFLVPWRLKGVAQRAEVAVILTWLLLTGLRLRQSVPSRAGGAAV